MIYKKDSSQEKNCEEFKTGWFLQKLYKKTHTRKEAKKKNKSKRMDVFKKVEHTFPFECGMPRGHW